MPKKVLVITYYWPPSGGGGVQRWLKFTKYLPDFGWQPTVFTPENPEFELKDASLSRDVHADVEVLRYPIWEPFGLYKKLFSKSSKNDLQQGVVIEKSNPSLFNKLVIWIRGNAFIPDPRKFWVKPAAKFLLNYVKENDIDVIVTTGPPHSMHLIGKSLKQKLAVKWVADFRDPWSDWDILDKLKTTDFSKRKHIKLEAQVLSQADIVLTVSDRMSEMFAQKCDGNKIRVVTNGMDEDDLKAKSSHQDKFRITHLGLLNELRDPVELWTVLEEFCNNEEGFEKDLEVVLSGTISSSVTDRIASFKKLNQRTVFHDYLGHDEVFDYYAKSSLLLLLMNQTKNADFLIPAKIFEYLGAHREILAFGSVNSDVNEILLKCEGGKVVEYSDNELIRRRILSAYSSFKQGKKFPGYSGVEQFYRKNLTKDLAMILDELTNDKI